MKTLQEVINESILDNDDILMNDVKNSANDPFVVYMAAVDNNVKSVELQRLLLDGLFDKFIKEELYLDPEDYFMKLSTYTDRIASACLYSKKDISVCPLYIRYRKKTKQFDIEIYKFDSSEKVSDIFEYGNYKKILSNFRKRGFKKSNDPIGQMWSYNVYVKKL